MKINSLLFTLMFIFIFNGCSYKDLTSFFNSKEDVVIDMKEKSINSSSNTSTKNQKKMVKNNKKYTNIDKNIECFNDIYKVSIRNYLIRNKIDLSKNQTKIKCVSNIANHKYTNWYTSRVYTTVKIYKNMKFKKSINFSTTGESTVSLINSLENSSDMFFMKLHDKKLNKYL